MAVGELFAILVLFCVASVFLLAFAGLIYLIIRAVMNRPPQASIAPPEIASKDQQRRDREHLKLLAIFHFVFGGLSLFGLGFLFMHYAIMHSLFSNPSLWKGPRQAAPPK